MRSERLHLGAKKKIRIALESSGEWRTFSSQRQSAYRRRKNIEGESHPDAHEGAWAETAETWGFDMFGVHSSMQAPKRLKPPETKTSFDNPFSIRPPDEYDDQPPEMPQRASGYTIADWRKYVLLVPNDRKSINWEHEIHWAMQNYLLPLDQMDWKECPSRAAVHFVKQLIENPEETTRLAKTVRERMAPEEARYADAPIIAQIDNLLGSSAA